MADTSQEVDLAIETLSQAPGEPGEADLLQDHVLAARPVDRPPHDRERPFPSQPRPHLVVPVAGDGRRWPLLRHPSLDLRRPVPLPALQAITVPTRQQTVPNPDRWGYIWLFYSADIGT